MFGDRLKELRKQNDMSQEKLGEYLGVTNNAIYNWEVGKAQPSIESIIKIAELFNVSTDYLFGMEKLDKEEKLIKALTEAGMILNIENITIEDLTNALKVIEMMKNKKDAE